MSDIRNYHLVYPNPRINEDEPSGGYVEVHVTHTSHEAERNIKTAVLLAKLGYQVRLLPIDTTFRTPDAYLIKEQVRIEFKHNQTPTCSAIDNELRDAQGQAKYVLIHVLSSIDRNKLIRAVKDRLKRTSAQQIKEIWLIWKEALFRFKRKDIFDGTIEQKIQ